MNKLTLISLLSFSLFTACSSDDSKSTISEKGIKTELTESDKNELLALVNKYRATGCQCGSEYQASTSPVVWNEVLEQAANGHSNDMNKNNFLQHVGSNGSTLGSRLVAVSYLYVVAAENIAKGYNTPAAVMQGWINSEGHCKNIMNTQVSEIGVSKVGSYWTQVFATKR
jgi:uncharacterized protein YkwD